MKRDYDPVSRIANERFLLYFMAPLFGVLFLWTLAIGVGVLTGIVETKGSRTWGWAFIGLSVTPVLWVLWMGRLRGR